MVTADAPPLVVAVAVAVGGVLPSTPLRNFRPVMSLGMFLFVMDWLFCIVATLLPWWMLLNQNSFLLVVGRCPCNSSAPYIMIAAGF